MQYDAKAGRVKQSDGPRDKAKRKRLEGLGAGKNYARSAAIAPEARERRSGRRGTPDFAGPRKGWYANFTGAKSGEALRFQQQT